MYRAYMKTQRCKGGCGNKKREMKTRTRHRSSFGGAIPWDVYFGQMFLFFPLPNGTVFFGHFRNIHPAQNEQGDKLAICFSSSASSISFPIRVYLSFHCGQLFFPDKNKNKKKQMSMVGKLGHKGGRERESESLFCCFPRITTFHRARLCGRTIRRRIKRKWAFDHCSRGWKRSYSLDLVFLCFVGWVKGKV